MSEEEARALKIHSKHVIEILSGRKKWEIRTRKTRIRGKIYLISVPEGEILGSVELVDVKGPFTVKELEKHFNKHRVSSKELENYSRGKELYAWVLEKPKLLKKRVKLPVKRGAQAWRKISKKELEIIKKNEK